jgi:hypothetical protein
MIMTVLEAHVEPDQWESLRQAYTSLGIGAYRSLLERAGMRLEHHYTDAWENYVYVAAKAAAPVAAGRPPA